VPVAGGRQQITVTMELPANAPPAEYTVRLIGFRNHEIAVQQETTFTLTRGTVNQFLGSLARNHGLLYGILAVVIAIGAGLFVGLIFGSTKEH
jgi:hypothetical protein